MFVFYYTDVVGFTIFPPGMLSRGKDRYRFLTIELSAMRAFHITILNFLVIAFLVGLHYELKLFSGFLQVFLALCFHIGSLQVFRFLVSGKKIEIDENNFWNNFKSCKSKLPWLMGGIWLLILFLLCGLGRGVVQPTSFFDYGVYILLIIFQIFACIMLAITAFNYFVTISMSME